MKLNLVELSESLKELKTAQKQQNYTNLIAETCLTLIRKNMNYSILGFCRGECDAKSVYRSLRQDAIKQVKRYLSNLQLQTIPITKQDKLLGQVILGTKQLQRLEDKKKLCPFFAIKSNRRINQQKLKISEQEYDASVWLSYLDRQCKEGNPQSNFIAELSKFADKC